MRNKSKKILTKYVITSLVLLALLLTGVFAWIYGNVTPEIKGDFKIGSMNGLNFVLDNTKSTLINLNTAYGLSTEMLSLNESSSADGVTFYTRGLDSMYLESGVSDPDEVIHFRTSEKNNVIKTGDIVTGVTGDYLDITFNMLINYAPGSDAEYYIYFLNGSMANTTYSTAFKEARDKDGTSISQSTDEGRRALRACLQVSKASAYGPVLDNTDHIAIFGNVAELGTTEAPFHTSAVEEVQEVYLRDSQTEQTAPVNICGTYTIDYLTKPVITSWPHVFGNTVNQTVNSFASCSIDPDNNDGHLSGTTLPNDNYLFKMDKDNHSVTVTLRVWLEGGSEYCSNGKIVPDDKLKLDLFFVAFTKDEVTQ